VPWGGSGLSSFSSRGWVHASPRFAAPKVAHIVNIAKSRVAARHRPPMGRRQRSASGHAGPPAVRRYITLLPDGRYKLDGDPGDCLWWAAGLRRLGPAEVSSRFPEVRRLPPDVPIFPA
jgi:hypothetical protein